jgi:hypothetical protein
MHFSSKALCQYYFATGNANQNGLPIGPRAGERNRSTF